MKILAGPPLLKFVVALRLKFGSFVDSESSYLRGTVYDCEGILDLKLDVVGSLSSALAL